MLKENEEFVGWIFAYASKAYTAVEEVLIIKKKFAKFFGPSMFIRS